MSEKYHAVSLKKNTIETIAFHTSKRVEKDNLSHLKEEKNLVEFLLVQILVKIVVVTKFAKIK